MATQTTKQLGLWGLGTHHCLHPAPVYHTDAHPARQGVLIYLGPAVVQPSSLRQGKRQWPYLYSVFSEILPMRGLISHLIRK